MTDVVQRFAEAVLNRYRDAMLPADLAIVTDDYAAGEYEVAATSVIEVVDASEADVDELERLAEHFTYSTDLKAARSVIAKQRRRGVR